MIQKARHPFRAEAVAAYDRPLAPTVPTMAPRRRVWLFALAAALLAFAAWRVSHP